MSLSYEQCAEAGIGGGLLSMACMPRPTEMEAGLALVVTDGRRSNLYASVGAPECEAGSLCNANWFCGRTAAIEEILVNEPVWLCRGLRDVDDTCDKSFPTPDA